MSDPFLTPEDVAEIIAILDSSPYHQIDIGTRRFRLTVRRDTSGGEQTDGWTQEWQFAEGAAPATAETASASTHAPVPTGLVAVTAPLPGTFYRAPSPGAPPYVEVGDQVTAETVVGIVETMKLMNPVHAGVAGTVRAIPAGNATQVHGGEPLLHVEPA